MWLDAMWLVSLWDVGGGMCCDVWVCGGWCGGMACGVWVLKFFNGDRTKGEGWGWCVVKTHTHFFKIFGNFSFRYHPYYYTYLIHTFILSSLHIPSLALPLHSPLHTYPPKKFDTFIYILYNIGRIK